MIGLVTIGQAPREDVVMSMFGDMPEEMLLQYGALDGLGWSEIAQLAPGEGDHVLVSRLADGTEVTLGKRAITPLVQRAIHRAEDDDVGLVCVLCTGRFDGLTSRLPLIFPDRVVKSVVDSLLPVGVLGVLMPHEDQRPGMVAKWSSANREVVTAVASPYTAAGSLNAVTQELREAGAELIVLDCMGFTREMDWAVRAAAGKIPVVLSNGLVGAVLGEAWGLRHSPDDALSVEALD